MGVREREIYKVTLVGSVGNAALLAFKFVAGIVGHSSAMIADAVHSLSDFLTDIVVLIFVGISSKPQDETHDYGHGKFETVASFLIGLALLGAAVGIVVSGALKFARWLSGETLEMPGKLALWAALVSIVVKEALYRYTAAKGKGSILRLLWQMHGITAATPCLQLRLRWALAGPLFSGAGGPFWILWRR